MTIMDIIREEATRHGYTADELRGDGRSHHLCTVRQYAMWRARQESGRSYKEIALIFKRDHTTVIHGVQRMEKMSPQERARITERPVEEPEIAEERPMVTPVTSIWTPELTDKLAYLIRDGRTSHEVAELLGLSRSAVTGRAARMGLNFKRRATRIQKPNLKGVGHRAFTPRCAEILRAHGVRL